jgi:polyketide cyclase/dehydrase/lipid transport protein
MASRHVDDSGFVAARPEQVFDFVDDHARFSSHMSQSSWMMGGGRMSIEVDDAKGQTVGSHVRLAGRFLGLSLSLDEVVTRRIPPFEKAWDTVGDPHLIVIGPYRMGVEIRPETQGSRLRVFIDFDFPGGLVTYWLGRLFGRLYAKWCVRQMLQGVVRHFEASAASAA